MFRRITRWVGIGLGSLVGLVLVAAVALFVMGNARLNKAYTFPPSGIVVPTDAASVERGRHFAEVECAGCHGADLSGVNHWFEGGPLGSMDSANLTSGQGGSGKEYTDEDYVAALRHGIDRAGRPLYMPAVTAFQYLSDQDLAAVIAYLKTIPPVDHETHGQQLSPLTEIMIAAGAFGKLPVEAVSHQNNITAPAEGVTVEYGQYLVNVYDCKSCHGEQLAGGHHPDPSVKALVPNLTPGGELGSWTEAEFIIAIRTGATPGGHPLDPKIMPWKSFAKLTDDELRATWAYLQSLPRLGTKTQ